MPKERYSYGAEIFEHCQRIGRHFGLYEHALFGTIVPRCAGTRRSSAGGSAPTTATISAPASSSWRRAAQPAQAAGVPGIRTSRATASTPRAGTTTIPAATRNGGLAKLNDKRVAIIGTGATAIQCVPHLGAIRQAPLRLPAHALGRRCPRQPADRSGLGEVAEARLAGERHAEFPRRVFNGLPHRMEDLVCDGWSEINRNMAGDASRRCGRPKLPLEELMADCARSRTIEAMERIRRRVDSIVKDKETAEMLKPWYRFLCKRPCFNDEYLPTFNRPNVTLVDVSDGAGASSASPRRASSPMASNTRSTASSTPAASR